MDEHAHDWTHPPYHRSLVFHSSSGFREEGIEVARLGKRRVGGCEVKSGMKHKCNFTALQMAPDMPTSDEALRHPYTYAALGSIRDGDAGLALGVSFQDENFD